MKPQPQDDKPLITYSRRARPKAAQLLTQTLHPIPFVPAKSLDLQPHHDFLKRLGLWDFLHIRFDPALRTDLIAELIANYSPKRRCSYVGDVRVKVSRAALGCALKLPVGMRSCKNVDEEVSKESICLVENLVGNWVLLKGDEMMGMPKVMGWHKNMVEGHFGNVDWAGLIWFMVEKELLKGDKLRDCYYASLLQLLIKSQCEALFESEEAKEGGKDDFRGGRLEENGLGQQDVEEGCDKNVYVKQENLEKVDVQQDNVDKVDVEKENVEKFNIGLEIAEELDVELVNVEKVGIGQETVKEKVDVELENVEDLNVELENAEDLNVELESVEKFNIELENVEKLDVDQENGEKGTGEKVLVDLENEEIMNIEYYKDWPLAGKENFREPCLRQCNLDGVRDLGCGNERKKYIELGDEEDGDHEEEEDDDQERGADLSMKDFSLEGLSSGTGRLMDVMEGGHIPLSSGMPVHDHLATDFSSSRLDLMLPGSSSLSVNGHKREFTQFNHENDNSLHGLNSNKRVRTDGPWHSKMPGDLDMCMEHVQQWVEKTKDIQQWMGKARMMYVAKEQECEDAKMDQQLLLVELQKKDELIEHLHKARTEVQQKRQTEKYRFDHEVYLMQNLLNGYRKTIKATQKAFAEYRARPLQAAKPLYRDVSGSGGLVLSAGELKKLRLKQEEEERMKHLAIETKSKGFEAGWIGKSEGHHKSVEIVSDRLLDVEKGVKLLNEQLTERRLAETAEPAPNES